MSPANPLSFSPDGELLACVLADSRLRIYDTKSNIVKQEYVPSSHLKAAFTCLTWCHTKKKNNNVTTAVSSSSLLCLGTYSGSVACYDVTHGEVRNWLKGGNHAKIHCIDWCPVTSKLYTGGADSHVGQWDIISRTAVRWLSQNQAVTAVKVYAQGTRLVTASRAIHCWNIESRELLMTFTGHANPVYSLLLTGDQTFICSVANGDRLICVWNLETGRKNVKAPWASFNLLDSPANAVISHENETVHLAATTTSGSLHIFRHLVTRKTKAPANPWTTVQIGPKTVKNKHIPHPIPIVASWLAEEPTSVAVAYGSHAALKCETLEYDSLTENTFLVRQMHMEASANDISNVTKVKTPLEQQGDVKHLITGHVNGTRKRQRNANNIVTQEELPMEERIIQQPAAGPVATTTKGGLVQLLIQGLKSQDKQLLQTVLQCEDKGTIQNTVKRLPLVYIMPFLEHLTNEIFTSYGKYTSITTWTRTVFSTHTSFLVSSPNARERLPALLTSMKTCTSTLSSLCQLAGKLRLMSARTNMTESFDDNEQEPLLDYCDESSEDESDTMEQHDLVPTASEEENSDDNMEIDGASDMEEPVNGDVGTDEEDE